MSYCTAGHGGIHLSPSRQAVVEQKFPGFTPFAGKPWYEEDCDVAVVILAFPEEFDDAAIRGAVRSVLGWSDDYFKAVASQIDVMTPLMERALKFETDNAHKWEFGGLGSCPEGWKVMLSRVGDKTQKKQVTFVSYPSQRFYTDEELEAEAVTTEAA